MNDILKRRAREHALRDFEVCLLWPIPPIVNDKYHVLHTRGSALCVFVYPCRHAIDWNSGGTHLPIYYSIYAAISCNKHTFHPEIQTFLSAPLKAKHLCGFRARKTHFITHANRRTQCPPHCWPTAVAASPPVVRLRRSPSPDRWPATFCGATCCHHRPGALSASSPCRP